MWVERGLGFEGPVPVWIQATATREPMACFWLQVGAPTPSFDAFQSEQMRWELF
jgi:hypothetical protein